MSAFLVILAVGIGTYLMRSLFVLALANRKIPPAIVRALDYVAPAVLSALVISLVVDTSGRLTVGMPEIVALVAGGLTVWKSRNFLLSAVVGMVVLWLITAIA